MIGEFTSHERLLELLSYDPEAIGEFRWKVWHGGTARPGSVAGSINGQGYRVINIDGRVYPAHRLAWFYVHGYWPPNDVDHKANLDKADNRIANLRPATVSQNQANRRLNRNSTSGFKGVYYNEQTGKYTAGIHNYYRRHLGTFDTAEEAHAAYAEAAKKLFGEFARP